MKKRFPMRKNSDKTKRHPRIVAGFLKGKKVECPPGVIRPMTSKVKEALFNIIGNIEGLTMLDLFTGSGNISIEAFSRGIASSDLIELDWGKKKIIKKNLEDAGFNTANLIISDAISYCKHCSKKYDFIMADPPFNWPVKEKLLRIISDYELITENGFLVIHLPKKEPLIDDLGKMIKYDIRTYGLNSLHFYKLKK